MGEVIDLKDVLERVQDDRELLLELLDIYQEDFVGKKRALGEAVNGKDFSKIKELAHSLKGASGNISARGMHANLLKIEQMAGQNDLSQVNGILTELDRQFAQLKVYAAHLKKEWGKA